MKETGGRRRRWRDIIIQRLWTFCCVKPRLSQEEGNVGGGIKKECWRVIGGQALRVYFSLAVEEWLQGCEWTGAVEVGGTGR